MLTGRGKVLLIAAVGAWVASRLLGVPELGMAAVGVAGLVALAVLHTRLASGRLGVARDVEPRRLFHDGRATVRLRLTNRGRLPTATVQVVDDAPAALTDAARFLLAPLGVDDSATLRYPLHGRQRGRFTIGPARIGLRDPFGVALRRTEVAVTDEVTVYPPVWRLPPGLPLGGRTGLTGEGRAHPRATGEELSTVREYVRGDDLRKVHWATTAHRGKLMVRQDESPQDPQGVVVLDRRARAHRGHGPRASFEAAVSTAASTTYHLARQSLQVRLVTGPDDGARPLPWELTLERLATLTPGREADLEGVWRQLARRGGEGALVAVTTLPRAGQLRSMVRAGRGFGVRAAVLLDAGTWAAARPTDTGDAVRALRAAGWRVTVLRHGDRLDHRWEELISQHHRPRRGRAAAAGTS